MKKILGIIVVVCLIIITFFQYKNYKRFRPSSDYSFSVNDSIDINYFDELIVGQYYKNCFEIGAFARAQWFQNGIDVKFPNGSSEAKEASNYYNRLITSTKRIEDKLIYSKNLKSQGFNNNEIKSIILDGLSKKESLVLRYEHLHNLSIGDESQNVFELQSILHQMGYEMPIDGTFGSETDNAIKKLQTENDIYTSGIVDKKTLEIIIERNE